MSPSYVFEEERSWLIMQKNLANINDSWAIRPRSESKKGDLRTAVKRKQKPAIIEAVSKLRKKICFSTKCS